MKSELNLLPLTLDIRDELFHLVDRNRNHLRQWLPWVDSTNSPEDVGAFLRNVIRQHEEGMGPQYSIYADRVLCGVCGYHKFDRPNRTGEIGYWLSKDHTGRGIMTVAVSEVIRIGFEDYGLNKIEIWCGVDNLKSRAIPERLGLKWEGRVRERELINGRFHDQALYSIVRSEFLSIEDTD